MAKWHKPALKKMAIVSNSTKLRALLSYLRKIPAVLFGLAASFLISAAQAQPISDEFGFPIGASYSPEEIGGDFTPGCQAQDQDGVLYFGGSELMTFDGERWTHSIISGAPFIYSLDFGADGKLWTATVSDLGWLSRENSGWVFHSLRNYIAENERPNGQVYQVVSHAGGAVFVTADRVYDWDGVRFRIWRLPGSRRLNAFRVHETVYVDYRRQGLFAIETSGLKLVIPQAFIGTGDRAAIIWMNVDGDRWLLGTGNGLIEYAGGVSREFAPDVSALLREANLSCGVKLLNGNYAFGTVNHGIVLMKADGSLDQCQIGDIGGGSTYISSLSLDRNGSVWATSPARIIRSAPGAASRVFDERSRLAPHGFRTIEKAGNRLFTLNATGVFRLNDDHRHFDQLPSVTGIVNSIVGDSDNVLVCGYHGAWRIRDGDTSRIFESKHDIQTALRSRHYPGVTLLAESGAPSIIAVADDGSSRTIVSGLSAEATSLAEDEKGDLWIATNSRNLFVAHPDAHAEVEPQAIGSNQLPSLEGTVYVSAADSGAILVVDSRRAWVKFPGQQKFVQITEYPARATLAISKFDAAGRIWVAHAASASYAASVGQITIHNGTAVYRAFSVPGLDVIGIPSSIYAEQDTSVQTPIWIGGTKSILRYVVTQDSIAPQPRAPLLHATARRFSNSAAKPISSALPYSTKLIEFEFAEPDYAWRPQLRLQTRIDGIDTDWVPAGGDSRRELTAVREGKYTFRVRAVAETGVASEPTVFQFEVAPPWWRTPTAAIAGILILIPIGYGLYRWRVQTLRNRNAELEHKVKERTEELEEANAAKTMFVANMSHDIRNPLNGIVGLALALEETKLDTKQREIIATLRECTTYLSSLVDDVLDFASIEAGKFELRAGPFVPADLLNSIVTTLRSEANQRGALITIETDPDLPPMLRGDAGRIQQILVNYLSNALKYAGGHIRLGVSVAADSPGEIEFFVADEGAGISDEDQKTLFTKFSRLDSARRDNIKGTGLGLAACRLLADAMGGSVAVESRLGAGSRFILRLPLTIAVEPERVSQDVSLPQTSVLLVEDTDYNAMAAEAVLAKLGLKCDRARTGEEAIRMFGEKRHNVVLLDRNLPDMDGTDVARKMRELENDGLQSVLLAVTAYCTEEDRALCLKAGMDAFVGKPLTPEKLRRVLLDASRRILGAATVEAPLEAQPKPAANTPEFDTTLLEYIADDATGGVAGQAQRFISALTEAYAQLVGMQSTDDLNALGDAAHKVLGHARMVGAPALTDAATQLETAARAGDTDGIARAFPRVATAVTKLTEALRRRSGAQKV